MVSPWQVQASWFKTKPKQKILLVKRNLPGVNSFLCCRAQVGREEDLLGSHSCLRHTHPFESQISSHHTVSCHLVAAVVVHPEAGCSNLLESAPALRNLLLPFPFPSVWWFGLVFCSTDPPDMKIKGLLHSLHQALGRHWTESYTCCTLNAPVNIDLHPVPCRCHRPFRKVLLLFWAHPLLLNYGGIWRCLACLQSSVSKNNCLIFIIPSYFPLFN